MEKAVIDRFEGDWAVLLLGDTSRVVNVPRVSVPENAMEGDWLRVELDIDEVISVTIDRKETRKMRRRIEEKLARLRRGEHLK
jgi:hypothetical protein